MKDITIYFYYKLILDNSMPFLLSRIVYLSFILINRSWYLLFCGIYESKKAWKIFLYFLVGLKLLYCCISSEELVHIALPLLQSFEYPCKYYFDLNQREGQLKCKLCTDDNTLKTLEIYFLHLS